jgi:hypothetical protein
MTSKPARILGMLTLVALLVPTILAVSWATPAGSSASNGPRASSPAAIAVMTVTTRAAGVAYAAVPADFESVMGYRPQVRDGLLVDPEGACSSPLPLPDAFAPACAEHDLGYDLLRYADLTGEPLGGWARTAIDRRLVQRMRATCARREPGLERALCSSAAYVATVTVEINSVRQLRGAPEETLASWAITAVGAAVVVTAGVGLLSRRQRSRRDPRARASAQAVPA